MSENANRSIQFPRKLIVDHCCYLCHVNKPNVTLATNIGPLILILCKKVPKRIVNRCLIWNPFKSYYPYCPACQLIEDSLITVFYSAAFLNMFKHDSGTALRESDIRVGFPRENTGWSLYYCSALEVSLVLRVAIAAVLLQQALVKLCFTTLKSTTHA